MAPASNLPVSHSVRQQNCANVSRRAVSNDQRSKMTTLDPEKKRLVQRYLNTLFHARQCQIDENQCVFPSCRIFKHILSHMAACSDGKISRVDLCAEFLSHLGSCTICKCLSPTSPLSQNSMAPASNLPVSHSVGQQNCASVSRRAVSNYRRSKMTSLDPKKKQLVQRYLDTLFHARQCQLDENQCVFPSCRIFKHILSHMAACSDGKISHVDLCAEFLSHLGSCTICKCLSPTSPFMPQAPVCNLLRSHSVGQQSSANDDSVTRQDQQEMTDSEKRKLMQQRLMILLHAQECKRQMNQSEGQVTKCVYPFCSRFKRVLSHMAVCLEGKFCCVPDCLASKEILSHFRGCTDDKCPIKLPL